MSDPLLKEVRDLLVEVRTLLIEQGAQIQGAHASARPQEARSESMAWESYLAEKKPANDYQIIALVVDELTGTTKPSATSAEIVDFIRNNPEGVKNTKPAALCAAIRNTCNSPLYGYIERPPKEKRGFRISIKGRQMISMLPSQETGRKKRSTKSKAR